MAVNSIKTVQKIPVSLQVAWDFFSNPANLQAITPVELNFIIISRHPGEKMYPGQILEYKVKPILGISLYWMTEITQVQEKELFIDQQRKGPFRMWHHQHHFLTIDGGVQMTDIVHYKSPLWLPGNLVNFLFIRKKLKEIFEYRFQKIEELFGKWPGGQPLQIEI